jgi:hypothetical protein
VRRFTTQPVRHSEDFEGMQMPRRQLLTHHPVENELPAMIPERSPGRSRRAIKGLLGVLFLVAGIAGAQVSLAAGLAFMDSFESGTADAWHVDGARDKCAVVSSAHDGGSPHSGNNMLECNWNGTVDWKAHDWYSTVVLSQSAWNYTREFLVRLWVRFDADVDHVNGDKILRLYPHDDLESFFLAAQMDQNNGPIFVYWEKINGKDGAVSWGKGTKLGDTQWHKLEIYMKHNTPGHTDGVTRVWIDDKLTQESVNIQTVADGRKWGPLILTSNWTNNPGWEHDASNHIYWDDVEIYTDLGSGGPGSMSDASINGGTLPAPNPPNKVAVH